MTKTNKIIYWITTIWLALGMLSTAIVQLLKAKAGTGGLDSIIHLGYPIYMLTLISIWKILGVVIVLIPKFILIKEWAYAGFFFLMSGAMFSHLAVNDSSKELFGPMLLLVLAIVSWYLRPVDRKIISLNN